MLSVIYIPLGTCYAARMSEGERAILSDAGIRLQLGRGEGEGGGIESISSWLLLLEERLIFLNSSFSRNDIFSYRFKKQQQRNITQSQEASYTAKKGE